MIQKENALRVSTLCEGGAVGVACSCFLLLTMTEIIIAVKFVFCSSDSSNDEDGEFEQQQRNDRVCPYESCIFLYLSLKLK